MALIKCLALQSSSQQDFLSDHRNCGKCFWRITLFPTLSNILPLKFQKLVTLSKPKWHTHQHQGNNLENLNGKSCNVDIQLFEEREDQVDMILPLNSFPSIPFQSPIIQLSPQANYPSPMFLHRTFCMLILIILVILNYAMNCIRPPPNLPCSKIYNSLQ